MKSKIVLVTGGCGSIGEEVVNKALERNAKQVRVFDNRENALTTMEQIYGETGRIRYLLGDVRDGNRLSLAMENVDVVFHCAALKHVPSCEYNPFEAVKTNIYGTQNVIDCALYQNVWKVVNISTDKAVNPVNVLGATKLLAEKLIKAGSYKKGRTIFANVRFGNVSWSSGSVMEILSKQLKDNKPLTITDPNMVRYFMSIEQAVDLIFKACDEMKGGETFILKMTKVKMQDLINAMSIVNGKKIPFIKTGKRTGEKLEEELMTREEKEIVKEKGDYYVIT